MVGMARLAQSDRASDSYDCEANGSCDQKRSEGREFDPRGGLVSFASCQMISARYAQISTTGTNPEINAPEACYTRVRKGKIGSMILLSLHADGIYSPQRETDILSRTHGRAPQARTS